MQYKKICSIVTQRASALFSASSLLIKGYRLKSTMKKFSQSLDLRLGLVTETTSLAEMADLRRSIATTVVSRHHTTSRYTHRQADYYHRTPQAKKFFTDLYRVVHYIINTQK